MASLKYLWHLWLHFVGMNNGVVETWWDGPTLMTGYRCTCGLRQGVHKTYAGGDFD